MVCIVLPLYLLKGLVAEGRNIKYTLYVDSGNMDLNYLVIIRTCLNQEFFARDGDVLSSPLI